MFGTKGLYAVEWVVWGISDGKAWSLGLILLGGGLLFVAGMLVVWQREAVVQQERSAFQDEVISYLCRIARAVEQRDVPRDGHTAAEILRNLSGGARSDKVRVMPRYRQK